MSHHGREYEDDREICGAVCSITSTNLKNAIEFIQAIAVDPTSGHATRAAEFLERNGFDGPLRAAREKKRRATELDAEIERLRAERAKL